MLSAARYAPNLDATAPLHWSWLTLRGPDATDFLHRLTTVQVRQLQPQQGAPGCFLSAQGKIRAAFTLWNLGEQTFAFEFEDDALGTQKKNLKALIDAYTFGEKLTVEEAPSSWQCLWIFPHAPASLPSPQPESPAELKASRLDPQGWILNQKHRYFGRPWVTVWGPAEALHAISKEHAFPLNYEALERSRIASLSARVGHEITDTVNPLEVGLRDAIADQKGCYPGQEVIEKILALGAPAKTIILLEGRGRLPPPGTALYPSPNPDSGSPAAPVGTVTSSIALTDEGEGPFHLLAWVRKTHASPGSTLGYGSPAHGSQLTACHVLRKV